jgi:hypothetical protein
MMVDVKKNTILRIDNWNSIQIRATMPYKNFIDRGHYGTFELWRWFREEGGFRQFAKKGCSKGKGCQCSRSTQVHQESRIEHDTRDVHQENHIEHDTRYQEEKEE